MNKQDLIDLHFKGATELYNSELIEKENCYIFSSKLIDDCYWNIGILKKFNADIDIVWDNVKNELQKRDRDSVLYIIPFDDYKISDDFKLLYTDVWMVVDNLKDYQNAECKIDVKFKIVTDDIKDEFVNAVMNGFSGNDPNDPYEELSDGYKLALLNSFQKSNIKNEFKIIHYAGLYKDIIVSTATVVYKKENAIIYNVTTKKQYQKMGICKEMMSYIISDLRKKGVKTVCVQTEQGYYTEKAYANMGFKEIMLGRAFTKKD